MKVQALCTIIGLSALQPSATKANPVTYSQQLCVMLRGGITQNKAWDHIVQEHTQPRWSICKR